MYLAFTCGGDKLVLGPITAARPILAAFTLSAAELSLRPQRAVSGCKRYRALHPETFQVAGER